ncbi:MAG TPA: hypothetical protein VNS09_22795 [Solirubrobacter sp.]|nr:hypothetical protein [Solirubrobacter sp.]
MNTRELRSLLDDVPDTFEIVLRSDSWSLELAAWRDAAEEAGAALAHWRSDRGGYAVYRAAQDREDAALDALIQTHTSRTSVS